MQWRRADPDGGPGARGMGQPSRVASCVRLSNVPHSTTWRSNGTASRGRSCLGAPRSPRAPAA